MPGRNTINVDFRQDSIVLSLSCKEEIDTCSLRALVLDTVCKLIRPIWLVAKLTSHLELNIRRGPDPGGSQYSIFIIARKYTTHLFFFLIDRATIICT